MNNEKVIVIKNEDDGNIQIILKIKNYTNNVKNILIEARKRYSNNDGIYGISDIDNAVIDIFNEHKLEYEILAYEADEFII